MRDDFVVSAVGNEAIQLQEVKTDVPNQSAGWRTVSAVLFSLRAVLLNGSRRPMMPLRQLTSPLVRAFRFAFEPAVSGAAGSESRKN
jgi:hypothetical protein